MFPKEENQRVQRVRFALRATGAKPEAANSLRSGVHTRGYLPHVKREGARYFVTFRLADSLPRSLLINLQAEHAAALRLHHNNPPAKGSAEAALREIELNYRRKLELLLDQGHGACWLKRPGIADLVAGALRHFDGQRYVLDAWLIMPNHVHAVFWPMPNHAVSHIVQSWKRFAAREANRILDRTGQPFWQPEAYDHWIRDDVEHARCCRYVENNPVKARLCDAPENWRWSSAWREAPNS